MDTLKTAYIQEEVLKDASFLNQLNTAIGESYRPAESFESKEDVDDDNYPLLDQFIPNGLKSIYRTQNFIKTELDTTEEHSLVTSTLVLPKYWLNDAYHAGLRLGAELYRSIASTTAEPVATQIEIALGSQANETEKLSQFCAGYDEACKQLAIKTYEKAFNVKFDSDTPHIKASMLGALAKGSKALIGRFKGEDQHIYVLGREHGHLGLSAYINDAHQRQDGGCPNVYFSREKHLAQFINDMHKAGYVNACQSVSVGGIGVALARLGKAANIGASVGGIGNASFWYGEDQARFVVTIKTAEMAKFEVAAMESEISLLEIGNTEEDALSFNNQSIKLSELVA